METMMTEDSWASLLTDFPAADVFFDASMGITFDVA